VIRRLMNLEGMDYAAGIQTNKDLYGYDINELPTINTLRLTDLPGPIRYKKLETATQQGFRLGTDVVYPYDQDQDTSSDSDTDT